MRVNYLIPQINSNVLAVSMSRSQNLSLFNCSCCFTLRTLVARMHFELPLTMNVNTGAGPMIEHKGNE
jgi:hypothetical protein